MKIAIDAHCIGKNLAGNGVYTFNLVKSLLDLYPGEEWFIYLSPEGRYVFDQRYGKNVRFRVLRAHSAWGRYLCELPRLLKVDSPDVLHAQYYGPVFMNCPFVVTVHDISYEIYGEYFTLGERMKLKVAVPYFARRSSKIVTVSEFSKNEIVKKYGFAEDKIATIQNGVNHDFFYPAETDEDAKLLKDIGAKKPFLLFVGSIQPRKNIEGLLSAMITARSFLPDIKLVVAGPEGWLTGGIKDMIKKQSDLSSIAVFTGYLNAEKLRALYRHCIALTYIPFYEGFGLPVLEAMACGAPVITSNVSSLPEVAGDAAIFADPKDINAISGAIRKIAFSTGLREDLKQKGVKRAGDFSWENTAKKMFSVFKETARYARN
ncbi:MAG: glycosyltransferase family 4 protein [Candidatus Omnitrophica bacterium]|nr:glycosyltransferase family 4 protein [Candidatus Omnitrophota bacterium]